MTARRAFLATLAACALGTTAARADEPCRTDDGRGGTIVSCFDPGNRLRLDATSAGVGGGLDLRHRVGTDDPRIHYRLEHAIASGVIGATRYDATLYSMRFVRHSENGYLVIPTSPPRQLSLPFDLGLEATALHVEGLRHEAPVKVGVVRVALLADFARSSDGRFRLAIGPAMRWDASFDRVTRSTIENDVAPFTIGALSAYAESSDGLTLGRLSAEAGFERFGELGSRRVLRAEASVERVILALNDHPLSVYAAGRAEDPGRGVVGEIGVRFALLTKGR